MTPLARIAAVAMAPDASWAVTVSADGTVRTRGAGTPSRLIRRAVPIDGSQPVAVALAGDRIRVLWGDGATIRLHENVKGAWPRDAEFPVPAPVRALALSPSGVLVVVACADGTLWMLDTGTGEFSPPVAAGWETARAVAVAAERGLVVAAFGDDSIRRYDLVTRTWDLVGGGPSITAVAVSPDGGTVVAAGTASYLLSWDLAGARPPSFRKLQTAATVITVDGTGGKVLAGRADGTLWLYDMAGGSEVEFGPAEVPPVLARPLWETPPATSPPAGPAYVGSAGPGAPAASLMDNDVRFTVYRPQAMSPGILASLLVFAHKTDLVEQPGQPPLDPNEQVEAIAQDHFGSTPVRPTAADATSGIIRGTRLRITVDLPGLHCDPASAEFDWREPVHHVVFQLLAPHHLVGSVVRGAVRVWRGLLILGEVSLAISITPSPPAVPPPAVAESARRYRTIFPSYSRDDGAIVDTFAEMAHAFGDKYLRDVVEIRAGERWRERVEELIRQAEIFQLFWSTNSMRSRFCREEWEYALSLPRESFVRPFYWEDPRPSDPANGLPPPALDALQFAKVSLYAAQGRTARAAEPDLAPLTGAYPAREASAPSAPPQAWAPEPPAAPAPASRPARMEEPEKLPTRPPPEQIVLPRSMPPPEQMAPTGPMASPGRRAQSEPMAPSRPKAPAFRRAGLAVAALVVIAVVVVLVFILKG